MKTTRRGFMGLVGGAAAAAAVPFTPKEVKAAQKVVPTFKIDMRVGPPYRAGDVVRNIKTNEMFLVKHAEAKRETITGRRGARTRVTTREADPGHKKFEKSLVLVPFLAPTAASAPIEAFKPRDLMRVGTAYNEGRDLPI
jgi:hypothetical protein